MGKKKSLFYQFQSSINDSESGHKKFVDKHSQKSQTEQESQPWRIYSFSAKSNLLDTAHNFSGYLKEQYDISKVNPIIDETPVADIPEQVAEPETESEQLYTLL